MRKIETIVLTQLRIECDTTCDSEDTYLSKVIAQAVKDNFVEMLENLPTYYGMADIIKKVKEM